MAIFVDRIAPYSIALFCALLTLNQWCAWRYRFARRYRSALSHAMRWSDLRAMPPLPAVEHTTR